MARQARIATTIVVGVMLVYAGGCSKRASDDTIAKDVQSKLAADPTTQNAPVSVSAQDRKVILKGTVPDTATQQKVEQIAKSEPGIAGVQDDLAVVPAAGAAAGEAMNQPAAAPAQEAAPPPPAPEPIVVPEGTSLVVTVDQALSSKTSKEGQTFLATVAQPVTVDGKTAIPKGSSVTGTVLTAKEKGKIKGEGQLTITLASITVRGKTYTIHTTPLDSTVKGKGKRTAATTGGGAAGGALIGGIAGGGKGAGIGALVGAGAGFVGGTLTGNKQIEIAAETPLTFALSKSLTLPPRSE